MELTSKFSESTKAICKTLIFVLLIFCGNIFFSFQIESQPMAEKEHVSGQPYFRFFIPETKNTPRITFYLSENRTDKPLPLVIYIQGSGNSSHFIKLNDGKTVPQNGHITLTDLIQNKARVLIVEKPGVEFLGHDTENREFDLAFWLNSWRDQIIKSIRYVIANGNIDTSHIIIIGHSEGGLAAAAVANKLNGSIKSVCLIAGEGISQYYSLYRFAEKGVFFTNQVNNGLTPVDSLEKTWRMILEDPFSVQKKFWGFTYLRWSSFLSTSVYVQLKDFDGNILIIQSEEDQNVFPESAKILYTGLKSKGRNANLIMIPHADHSFNLSDNPDVNGWETVLKYALNILN